MCVGGDRRNRPRTRSGDGDGEPAVSGGGGDKGGGVGWWRRPDLPVTVYQTVFLREA